MKLGRMFDAVFAGSVAAVVVGIVGGALVAIGSHLLVPDGADGGAAALGAVFSALAATPPMIGRMLGATALRHVVTGYAFALVGLAWLASLAYFYVPAVQALPVLLAASATAGIRFSQLAD